MSGNKGEKIYTIIIIKKCAEYKSAKEKQKKIKEIELWEDKR